MAQYQDLLLSYADAVNAALSRRAHADLIVALDNDFRVMGFTVTPD